MRLDLSSIFSIRQFAATFLEEFGTLDALVANAGVVGEHVQLSVDGLEMQFAVNHLGHFLLTKLLMPALLAARAGRVVVVASIAHVCVKES